MNHSPRIVLSHPGTSIFVQQVGRALYEHSMLRRFVTTAVDRPNAGWRKLIVAAVPGFGEKLGHWWERRGISEFPGNFVTGTAWRELLRLLTRQVDFTGGTMTDTVWEWSEKGFDCWVASHGLDGVTAVYGFEHACHATFREARRRGLACIYDAPAPHVAFSQRVRDQEIAANPALDRPYERRLRETHVRRTQRRREEFEMADSVIVNSEFTKSTYQAAGLDVSKLRVVPLGAPPVCSEEVVAQRDTVAHGRPLRFLYVGSFALHKGAHHLLAAWRKLDAGKAASLEIVGPRDLPRTFLNGLRGSVHFRGVVPRAEILGVYRNADVLVFPTLCDGFGMVVTEALSQGLPVITTTQAGAAERLRHGVSGLVIPPGDAAQLAEAMDWCLDNRTALHAMRSEARADAAAWQWSDYRRALIAQVLTALKGSSPIEPE